MFVPNPKPTYTIRGTDESLTKRALLAYLRQPDSRIRDVSDTHSGLTFHDDRAYVVLRNRHNVTIAVYRVRWDQLRRMRRWPKEVENPTATNP
jgi:hypothetical protein